jgi:hypothetical protein
MAIKKSDPPSNKKISVGMGKSNPPSKAKYRTSILFSDKDIPGVSKGKKIMVPVEAQGGKMMMKKSALKTMSSSAKEGISEAAQQIVGKALKKKPVSKK